MSEPDLRIMQSLWCLSSDVVSGFPKFGEIIQSNEFQNNFASSNSCGKSSIVNINGETFQRHHIAAQQTQSMFQNLTCTINVDVNCCASAETHLHCRSPLIVIPFWTRLTCQPVNHDRPAKKSYLWPMPVTNDSYAVLQKEVTWLIEGIRFCLRAVR